VAYYGLKLAYSYRGTAKSIRPGTENSQMLGWMMVFGLMAILAAILTVAADPLTGFVSAKIATYIFGVLFVACLLTSVARGRV
jgi:hypothetical protein